MRALLLAGLLACGSSELDLAKAVVEAEGHEDVSRRDLARLERDLVRLDAEIAAAPDAAARLAKERVALERSIETQQATVREAEIAARKLRIQSKQ